MRRRRRPETEEDGVDDFDDEEYQLALALSLSLASALTDTASAGAIVTAAPSNVVESVSCTTQRDRLRHSDRTNSLSNNDSGGGDNLDCGVSPGKDISAAHHHEGSSHNEGGIHQGRDSDGLEILFSKDSERLLEIAGGTLVGGAYSGGECHPKTPSSRASAASRLRQMIITGVAADAISGPEESSSVGEDNQNTAFSATVDRSLCRTDDSNLDMTSRKARSRRPINDKGDSIENSVVESMLEESVPTELRVRASGIEGHRTRSHRHYRNKQTSRDTSDSRYSEERITTRTSARKRSFDSPRRASAPSELCFDDEENDNMTLALALSESLAAAALPSARVATTKATPTAGKIASDEVALNKKVSIVSPSVTPSSMPSAYHLGVEAADSSLPAGNGIGVAGILKEIISRDEDFALALQLQCDEESEQLSYFNKSSSSRTDNEDSYRHNQRFTAHQLQRRAKDPENIRSNLKSPSPDFCMMSGGRQRSSDRTPKIKAGVWDDKHPSGKMSQIDRSERRRPSEGKTSRGDHYYSSAPIADANAWSSAETSSEEFVPNDANFRQLESDTDGEGASHDEGDVDCLPDVVVDEGLDGYELDWMRDGGGEAGTRKRARQEKLSSFIVSSGDGRDFGGMRKGHTIRTESRRQSAKMKSIGRRIGAAAQQSCRQNAGMISSPLGTQGGGGGGGGDGADGGGGGGGGDVADLSESRIAGIEISHPRTDKVLAVAAALSDSGPLDNGTTEAREVVARRERRTNPSNVMPTRQRGRHVDDDEGGWEELEECNGSDGERGLDWRAATEIQYAETSMEAPAEETDDRKSEDNLGEELNVHREEGCDAKSHHRYLRPLAVESRELWSYLDNPINRLAVNSRAAPRPNPPRLNAQKIGSLRWARRYLFAALSGRSDVPSDLTIDTELSEYEAEQLAPESQDEKSTVFSALASSCRLPVITSSRLASLFKALRIPASEDEIKLMTRIWRPHSHPQTSLDTAANVRCNTSAIATINRCCEASEIRRTATQGGMFLLDNSQQVGAESPAPRVEGSSSATASHLYKQPYNEEWCNPAPVESTAGHGVSNSHCHSEFTGIIPSRLCIECASSTECGGSTFDSRSASIQRLSRSERSKVNLRTLRRIAAKEMSSDIEDGESVITWDQFAWIFDDVQLKAEINGRVW